MNAYNKLQNEGGEGYVDYAKRYPTQPTQSEQDAILAQTKAELDAAFSTEWTAEVTAARRATWNDAIKAKAPKTAREAAALEKAVGFTLTNLKRAVAMHSK